MAEAITRREVQVLALIAEGMPNKNIARQLGIRENTVKTHVWHIMQKLGANTRTQAAVMYYTMTGSSVYTAVPSHGTFIVKDEDVQRYL